MVVVDGPFATSRSGTAGLVGLVCAPAGAEVGAQVGVVVVASLLHVQGLKVFAISITAITAITRLELSFPGLKVLAISVSAMTRLELSIPGLKGLAISVGARPGLELGV